MEYILFRTELNRSLTYSEIDNNFKYVSNPWSSVRQPYTTGMIVYHDLVPNKFVFYRANKTTTFGIFVPSEWDAINNLVVSVITSSESSLSDYILNEWSSSTIKIGDYLKLANDAVYVLSKNDGNELTDYLNLNGVSGNAVNIITSTQNNLTDYIVNEWDNSIDVGDILVLSNNLAYLLVSADGSSVSNYILISSSSITWSGILGKPNSTPTQLDLAVANSHAKNTDTHLDFGGLNVVSALEIKSHLNNQAIHFLMADIVLDHASLTSKGVNTHAQIDSHISDTTRHYLQSAIDHSNILNKGTYTHAQIDTHLANAVHTHVEIDQHLDSGVLSHNDIDSHISNIAIHFEQSDIDHNNIINKGTNSHTQIDSHISNTSLHFTQASINHFNISNVGTNSHVQIDSHIANSLVHFEMSAVDHALISNVGSYSHSDIDFHINDASIHALPGTSIDHLVLDNIGVNTHDQLDSHLADNSVHYLQSSIAHSNLIGSGSKTHTEIDAHLVDTSIHFTLATVSSLISSSIQLTNGSGVNSLKMLTNNLVPGSNSISMGSNNIVNANNSAILSGTNNQIDSNASSSAILSGNNILATESDTAYAKYLSILGGEVSLEDSKLLIWEGTSTNESATEIYLLNNEVFTIPLNSSVMFTMYVNAYNSVNNVAKIYELRGGFKRNATTSSSIGSSVSSFLISQDGPYDGGYSTANWNVVVSTNTTNKTILINVFGEVSKTIKWKVLGLLTISKF